MKQVHQKRYNLMIVGQEAVDKLDSLPERHKGMYVSEAIIDRIRKEYKQRKEEYPVVQYMSPNTCEKEISEENLRKIIREEISKAKD